MMRNLITAAALVVAATSATAQTTRCAPTDEALNALQSKYGEVLQTMGMTSSGTPIATYSNTQNGSWTILEHRPNGMSCLIASGIDMVLFDNKTGEPA